MRTAREKPVRTVAVDPEDFADADEQDARDLTWRGSPFSRILRASVATLTRRGHVFRSTRKLSFRPAPMPRKRIEINAAFTS